MRTPRLLAAIALIAGAPAARAATWTVDPNGTGDATTIQAGVDLASPGDSVLVLPGTYHEQVNLTKDDLVIASALGAEATIVDAEPLAFCLKSGANVAKSVISGLTFTGARGGYDYGGQTSFGVSFRGDAEIYDCVFRDNWCNRGSAIVQEGTYASGYLSIVRTLFAENGAASQDYPDPGCGVPCVSWQGRLEIDDCRFERNIGYCQGVLAASGKVTIRNSVFEENGGDVWMFGMFCSGGGTWSIEHNLFLRNDAPLFDPWVSAPTLLELRNNTFAANADLDGSDPIPAAPGSIIRANVFTGGHIGLHLPVDGGGIVVECNDSWGNGVNWKGFDPSGANGNFSQPPLYCNAPLDVFTVAVNSPLLAPNNDCGVPIGAFGVGCGAVSIEPTTWGRIKGRYR